MTEQLFDRLHTSPEALSHFCKSHQITEFALFGSVLRDDFLPDSDIDVLVTFTPDAKISLLDLVAIQDRLSDLFQRSVDLIEKPTIEASPNWIRRQEILKSATVIYDGTRQSQPA
ncbi:MAG: nucleotidyltransferase family protein [Leptolyngbyaceae cyanobacterium SL_5_9]|nr:nucleotidyltransferase family protein [Leptolyngbyaceae cyanobacterium SL_5_9]NJO72806.1 nucleotidyltransferase family protein [Leptolyngbyaceae cyanobacterium RM1_406_9]